VPNNPSSASQTGTSVHANRSDAQCDTVVLDRQAPALALGASKTTVLTGEQVAFSSEASDAGAGLDNTSMRFELGAGAAPIAASSVSHAFAEPGSYVVTLRVKDRAGNQAVAQKVVTVEAAPAASRSAASRCSCRRS
jgi:hypothetical protein